MPTAFAYLLVLGHPLNRSARVGRFPFFCVPLCYQVSLVVNDEQTEVTDISVEVSEQGRLVVNAPSRAWSWVQEHGLMAGLLTALSALDGFDACHFAWRGARYSLDSLRESPAAPLQVAEHICVDHDDGSRDGCMGTKGKSPQTTAAHHLSIDHPGALARHTCFWVPCRPDEDGRGWFCFHPCCRAFV